MIRVASDNYMIRHDYSIINMLSKVLPIDTSAPPPTRQPSSQGEFVSFYAGRRGIMDLRFIAPPRPIPAYWADRHNKSIKIAPAKLTEVHK
jgi:hypothetical protein